MIFGNSMREKGIFSDKKLHLCFVDFNPSEKKSNNYLLANAWWHCGLRGIIHELIYGFPDKIVFHDKLFEKEDYWRCFENLLSNLADDVLVVINVDDGIYTGAQMYESNIKYLTKDVFKYNYCRNLRYELIIPFGSRYSSQNLENVWNDLEEEFPDNFIYIHPYHTKEIYSVHDIVFKIDTV
jgi:hypothetical protein